MELDGSRARKRAETVLERHRLGHEADVLGSLAHPGLVRLLEIRRDEATGEVTEVVTATVEHGSIAALGPQPVELAAGWGVAVATVLGDLHALGWAHGDVRADHILLDGQGRPLLCGLGAARRLADTADPDGAVAADLAGLAGVVGELAGPGRDADRLGRRLTRWSAGGSGGRRSPHPPDAARFIADVLAIASGARLGLPVRPPLAAAGAHPAPLGAPTAGETAPETSPPPESGPAGRLLARLLGGRRRRQPVAAAVAVALTGVAVVVALAAVGVGAVTGGGPRARPATSSPGLDPTAVSDVTSTRIGPSTPRSGYSLVTPASGRALTVLGRWGCGADRPAVLYLADGQVWVFGAWPAPGSRVAAVAVASVPGATGLAVTAGRKGCDQLVVLRSAAPPLALRLGPGQ